MFLLRYPPRPFAANSISLIHFGLRGCWHGANFFRRIEFLQSNFLDGLFGDTPAIVFQRLPDDGKERLGIPPRGQHAILFYGNQIIPVHGSRRYLAFGISRNSRQYASQEYDQYVFTPHCIHPRARPPAPSSRSVCAPNYGGPWRNGGRFLSKLTGSPINRMSDSGSSCNMPNA